jgi:hypothetical protein
MNNKNKTMMLTYEQYIILWKTSFLSLISFATACYNKKYYCSLIPLIVFFTSINHWRKPEYSWRRNIDLFCVRTGLVVNLIVAYNSQNYKLFYPVVFAASSCYPISIFLNKRKKIWASVYVHVCLHILGNASCIILYSGDILPLNENPLTKPFYILNTE